jgi:hypothetical protein
MARIRFLEAVHYEKTPEGHLLLSHPESVDVQRAVEGKHTQHTYCVHACAMTASLSRANILSSLCPGGLQALEWFERQNNKGGGGGRGGDGNTDEPGRHTGETLQPSHDCAGSGAHHSHRPHGPH